MEGMQRLVGLGVIAGNRLEYRALALKLARPESAARSPGWSTSKQHFEAPSASPLNGNQSSECSILHRPKGWDAGNTMNSLLKCRATDLPDPFGLQVGALKFACMEQSILYPAIGNLGVIAL